MWGTLLSGGQVPGSTVHQEDPLQRERCEAESIGDQTQASLPCHEL